MIERYGDFYPELVRNQSAILDNLTREEKRFQRTVEGGLPSWRSCSAMQPGGQRPSTWRQAFDLYATYGLPLEITRMWPASKLWMSMKRLSGAMEAHRLASGAGEAFGAMGGEDVDVYRRFLSHLQTAGKLARATVSDIIPTTGWKSKASSWRSYSREFPSGTTRR